MYRRNADERYAMGYDDGACAADCDSTLRVEGYDCDRYATTDDRRWYGSGDEDALYVEGRDGALYAVGNDSERAAAIERARLDKKRRFALMAGFEAALACALALCLMLQVNSRVDAAVAKEQVPGAGAVAAKDVAASGDDNMASPHEEQEEQGWETVLVNASHPFEGQVPRLVKVGECQVDARCAESLNRLFDAARADGLYPAVNSSYRSREEQQAILDGAITEQIDEGMTREQAEEYALAYVAKPGCSEHETGLAIDVTSESRDGGDDDMAVHEWMAEHSWEYGWIMRYPADKIDITGINNEPWHYRYVGTDAARQIHERDICLEEYVDAD